MLPEGPSSSENIMTLPTDVHLHLPISLSSSSSSSTTTTTTTHNNYFISNQIKIDQIFPGIYLTNIGEYWTNDRLRSHGFTHIIIIDKHIQNYATLTENKIRANANMNNSSSTNSGGNNNNNNSNNNSNNNNNNNNSNVLSANLAPFSSLLLSLDSMKSVTNTTITNEFEILDLNFGEESYLTTVLPNCYKAVKFIDKALQYGGAILVIDRISNQKCLTIVIAYLMYKNNLNFNDAFQRIRKIYETAELEKFFISQLYEYEPILQVQRAQSKGHSCSRELRMAFLKRKKLHDDHNVYSNTICGIIATTLSSSSSSTTIHSDNYNNFYNLISLTNNSNSNSSHDNITSGGGDVSME